MNELTISDELNLNLFKQIDALTNERDDAKAAERAAQKGARNNAIANRTLTEKLLACENERDELKARAERAEFYSKGFMMQNDQLRHLLQGGTLTKEQVLESGLGEGVLIEQRHLASKLERAEALRAGFAGDPDMAFDDELGWMHKDSLLTVNELRCKLDAEAFDRLGRIAEGQNAAVARAERAEVEIHQRNSVIKNLESNLERAEAAGAAKDAALVRIKDELMWCGCTQGSFIYGCSKCIAKNEIIEPALSTTCGQPILDRIKELEVIISQYEATCSVMRSVLIEVRQLPTGQNCANENHTLVARAMDALNNECGGLMLDRVKRLEEALEWISRQADGYASTNGAAYYMAQHAKQALSETGCGK